MRRLGLLFEAGDDWARLGELLPAVEQGARLGLERVMEMAEAPPGEPVGEWRIRFRLGAFGTDYLARAGAACAGLEAGPAADLLPALVRTAADGRPLTGRRRYVLHFPPGAVPPVHGFWTLTTYDDREPLVDNPVDAYATGDWNGLTFDARRVAADPHPARPPARGGPVQLAAGAARPVQPAAAPDLADGRRARPELAPAGRHAARVTGPRPCRFMRSG